MDAVNNLVMSLGLVPLKMESFYKKQLFLLYFFYVIIGLKIPCISHVCDVLIHLESLDQTHA